MKTSAVIRIVVWGMVALILTGILVVVLRGGGMFNFLNWGNNFSYADSDRYTVGGAELSVKDIEKIEVHWISGKVDIGVSSGDKIEFSEQTRSDISEEDRMRYLVEGNTLIIQYYAPRSGFNWFRGGNLNKTLSVQVPETLAGKLEVLEISTVSGETESKGISANKMKFDTVSGGLKLADIVCEELSLNSVSGGITAENVTAKRLDSESVSGGTKLSGSYQRIDSSSVSGGVKIESTVCPEKAEINTVSGSVSLSIPENDGFTARHDSVSGSFRCDFETRQESKEKVVHKNGSADIYLHTVSGGMDIYKLGA